MCGITGFLGGRNDYSFSRIIENMARTQNHRGPDGCRTWIDENSRIALAHNRLAILDLSHTGAQPMVSSSGRWVLTFNGEIYNHQLLRIQLEKSLYNPMWRGRSDTETLLAGFDAWGVDETIRRCVGMFAFAVWDRKSQTLILGRDRLGEKPLYYGWQGSGQHSVFIFGSELKSLRAHPNFIGEINIEALGSFMNKMTVTGSSSIYRGIKKVPAGTLLEVSLHSSKSSLRPYWSIQEVIQRGLREPFKGDDLQVVDELEVLLKDAVRQQMLADVPLGAFLSGGIDSSTVVALMQSESSSPIRTYTIGFYEDVYNEAKYAKDIAQHLRTNHTELYVTSEQARDLIPQLPNLYDEPFADSSQIATHLVCKLARQNVTVALSGDGGDELFSGYNRYLLAGSLWGKLQRIPMPLRRGMSRSLMLLSPEIWNGLAKYTNLEQYWSNLGSKIYKGAQVMCSNSIAELHQSLLATGWANPENVVIGLNEFYDHSQMLELDKISDVERMMALDLITYLPDDILVKIDRAAMGVSLETRVPLLDHRVVEFAWRLPLHFKLRKEDNAFRTKWALRKVLYRYVPQSLVDRPKMGFGVPIDSWLRGPLREWAEDLLSVNKLRLGGYLNPRPIREKWAEHLSGKRNWQHSLWCVLMFQAWLSKQASP